MSISSQGIAFIQGWEAFRSKLYNDVAGHCTIGYGHLVHKGSCDSRAGETGLKQGITQPQGATLMMTKLNEMVSVVRKSVKVELTQYEFDALVSFTYNVGASAFRASTLLRLVNSGQWASIRQEFLKWVHAGGKRSKGLVNRRNAEAALFLQGKY